MSNTEDQLTAALARADAAESKVKELEAKCADKDDALHKAWTDIQHWLQLAINHRKALGERANFEPYCPTTMGIESSEQVCKTIGSALSSFDCGKGWRSPEEYAELERKCAEMRGYLEFAQRCGYETVDGALAHALSLDCGKGYKSPAKVREMLEPELATLQALFFRLKNGMTVHAENYEPAFSKIEALVKEAK